MLCLAAAGKAAAQMLSGLFPEGVPGYDASPGVTVLSRRHPEYDPIGMRAGVFRLWPRLEEAIGYDDNVLAGPHRQGSFVVTTRPSLLINSDWSRNAIGAYFSASDTRYLAAPAQSRTDGTLSLGGTLDIGRGQLTLAGAHLAQHQDRSALDAIASDRPVGFTVDDVRASYAVSADRWTITPSVELSSWRYGGTTILGQPASQAYRNRDVSQGGITLRYEWAPLRDLLLVTRVIGQHYPAQFANDSTGYQVLFGIDHDANAVWRYRVLLGGESRQFAAQPAHTAIIAEAEVTWSPSGLTTIHGTLTRSMEDAAQEGVAGFTYTAGRLGIDHEYRRNVVLSASALAQRADFLHGGAPQTGYGGTLGITWLVNRTVHLSATYDLIAMQGAHVGTTGLPSAYARQLTLLTLQFGL